MRKRKDLLNALRQEHKPFWEFVCWVWAHQNMTGGIVVLEQPAQSDAPKQPMMARRENVYEKTIHMCMLGMVDYVSGMPRKKATIIQMNNPTLLSAAFPDRVCNHTPGEHQPIEGSVFCGIGTNRDMSRSTALLWPPCGPRSFVVGF